MTLLYIETSTNICSIGISVNNEMAALRESSLPNVHSKNTTVFISEVLSQLNMQPADIDAVVVSLGPGSYTGLRIGVSSAKGICFAISKPLIAINSLQALARKAAHDYDDTHLFCPMIDARRMEVYSGIYDNTNNEIRKVQADVVDENTYVDYVNDKKLVLLGDGASKFTDLFANDSRYVIDAKYQFSATNMIEMAQEAYEHKIFEDVAYFEPFYLKDFIAGAPRVKGLR
jgi:tRNA threonylcarbamoyladenosine biosynthesis protein TsaB